MRAAVVLTLLLALELTLAGKAKGNGIASGNVNAKAKGKGKGKGKGKREEGKRCADTVAWVMRVGIIDHPQRFPGLSRNSSFNDVQQRLHKTMPSAKCTDPLGRSSEPLPTFTSQLALNRTQLVAYRELRKANAATLKGSAFKALSADAKQHMRRELLSQTARAMQSVLNASQLALFVNRSFALRRPPSMHAAADLLDSKHARIESRLQRGKLPKAAKGKVVSNAVD